MSEYSTRERVAYEDVFFSIALVWVGFYYSLKNWVESDWLGLFGTTLLLVLGGLWLAVRIYHLTHKEEVFGVKKAAAHNTNLNDNGRE